jgi:hypothetical protein
MSLGGNYTQSSGTFNTAGYDLDITGTSTISGGTFTGSSGSHSFGNLTLSGGTFSASTGTTTIAGNFTKSAGDFTPNGGTISLTGTTNNITGNTTFSNLSKIATASSTLTFSAGGSTIITATTTLKGTSGNILSLRSSTPDTQWFFDPEGGLDLGYLNVKDSYNVNASSTNINPIISAADYPSLSDGGNNTNWVFTVPILTVTATGTQNASTTLPISNQYMGGAFVFTHNSGTTTVTSIALTQLGSLPTTNISSVELYYEPAINGLCSTAKTRPVNATLFGTTSTWSASRATTTGTMSVGSDNPTCLYVQFDLTGTLDPNTIFDTVDLQVSNPSVDIISVSDISTTDPVNIIGSTIIEGGGSGLPVITLSASPSGAISAGESVNLTWTTSFNPSSCEASGDNGDGGSWTGSKSPTGGSASSGTLNEHKLYRFTLSCTNSNGTSVVTTGVNVIHPNAPVVTFTADPNTGETGYDSILSWSNLTGLNTPDLCVASGAWSDTKTPSGSQEINNITARRVYTLACGNTFGTTTKSVSVDINSAPAVPPSEHCNNNAFDEDLGETAVDFGGPCSSGLYSGNILYGDSITLIMPDESINPTVFYFMNDGRSNALYMRQGSGSDEVTRKLTAEGLHITNGKFTRFACAGDGGNSTDCAGVRINIELQKLGSNNPLQNFTIEKTFRTTAVIRKNF